MDNNSLRLNAVILKNVCDYLFQTEIIIVGVVFFNNGPVGVYGIVVNYLTDVYDALVVKFIDGSKVGSAVTRPITFATVW
jgi:hypothetical protein